MSDDNLEVKAWRMLAHQLQNDLDKSEDAMEWSASEASELSLRLREAEADLATLRSQNEFLLKERAKVVAYARRIARERVGNSDSSTDALREFARDLVKGKHLENGGKK